MAYKTKKKQTEEKNIETKICQREGRNCLQKCFHLFNPHIHEIFLQLYCMEWVLGDSQKEILN